MLSLNPLLKVCYYSSLVAHFPHILICIHAFEGDGSLQLDGYGTIDLAFVQEALPTVYLIRWVIGLEATVLV